MMKLKQAWQVEKEFKVMKSLKNSLKRAAELDKRRKEEEDSILILRDQKLESARLERLKREEQ